MDEWIDGWMYRERERERWLDISYLYLYTLLCLIRELSTATNSLELYAFAKDEAFLESVRTHLYINRYKYRKKIMQCMYSFMDG